LPDARELTAGGKDDGQSDGQIFSPPYLFLGARPVISAAPSAVGHGQSFFVNTPDASGIARVTWVRHTAVTHAFNQNQRFNELSFGVVGATQLSVTAPSPNLAPPGHYLLFLLSSSGVPSVAAIVKLGGTSGGGSAPVPPPDLGSAPAPDLGSAPAPSSAPAPDLGSGGAPSGVLFHDGFNRTGALGANWTVAHGTISANGAAAVGTSARSYAFWIGQPDPNGTVTIEVGKPIAATYYGVTARANPAAPDRDHYAAYVQPNGVVALARRDNYVYTYLGTGASLGSGQHQIALTATGTAPVVLSVKLDGVEVIHATDGSAQARASGLCGIFDYNGLSQPLDEFTVYGAGGATTGGGTGGGAVDAGVVDASSGAGGGAVDAGVVDASPSAPDLSTGTGSTVLFHDELNRTGALGASWSVAFGAFSVNGSAAVGTLAPSYAFWTGLPSPNATVSLAFAAPLAPTYFGVTARANPSFPDRDHYAAYLQPDGVVGLARRDNYGYVYLGTGPKVTSGVHHLSLTATGSSPVQLSVKLDGVEVIHASDGSAQARPSGLSGMFDYRGLSQPLDDFTVTLP
jgi:hypothetical protein